MHPKKMKLLTDEIRGRFKDNSEITFEALAKLEYMNACMGPRHTKSWAEDRLIIIFE